MTLYMSTVFGFVSLVVALLIYYISAKKKQGIPFFFCQASDGTTSITYVHDRIWNFYHTIGRQIKDFPFPLRTDAPHDWYDKNHAKAFLVGEKIVGPMVLDIYKTLKNFGHNIIDPLINFPIGIDPILRIAILGDSTTEYASSLATSQPWKIINLSCINRKRRSYLTRRQLKSLRRWKKLQDALDKYSECLSSEQYYERQKRIPDIIGSDIIKEIQTIALNIVTKKRRAGLSKFLRSQGIHENIIVDYYSISGSKLDARATGFLSQLACILQHHHSICEYSCILMIGGWNNKYVDYNHFDTFRNLLKSKDSEDSNLRFWTSPNWIHKIESEISRTLRIE